jgi:hypothetical protein
VPRQVWSSLVKSGQVWSSLVKSGQVWSSLVKSGQVRSSPIAYPSLPVISCHVPSLPVESRYVTIYSRPIPSSRVASSHIKSCRVRPVTSSRVLLRSVSFRHVPSIPRSSDQLQRLIMSKVLAKIVLPQLNYLDKYNFGRTIWVIWP